MAFLQKKLWLVWSKYRFLRLPIEKRVRLEISEDGQAGEIVPPGDVKALAGALLKLMGDAKLRSRLGKAARKRFEERFNPDRVMREILEVYCEAVERTKNRRKEV